MIHQLKLEGPFLADAVVCGDKPYEIRVNNRNFAIGDMLCMALYDKAQGRYVKHSVNDYMYTVTYMSKIHDTGMGMAVMGITKTIPSQKAIECLVDTFMSRRVWCNVTMYDETINNCKITNRFPDGTVTINTGDSVLNRHIHEIVWIVDSTTPDSGRSVRCADIGFDKKVDYTNFLSYHVHELYERRVETE